MKYFSMFTGIGGFDLAFNRQGHQCIGFSEIDKYAIYIYNKNFEEVTNYGDATTINEKRLPDFDILCGGFPCQSFSIAGKRKGFKDTRGTLFFDICRIIKHKRPRFLLLENVKGLLSHDEGKTFETIIRSLDELGYDAQWVVLNSKNFGVPQNRERVFIIGYLREECRQKILPFRKTCEVLDDRERETQRQVQTASCINERLYKMGRDDNYIKQLNNPVHSTNRLYSTDGLARSLRANACGKGAKTGLYQIKVPEATKQGFAIAEEGDSINLSVPNSTTRRGRVGKGLAQTLDTGMQQYTVIPVLTPDRPVKRQNGRRFKEDGDDMFTLTGQDKHRVCLDKVIRRLTPTECERLQGFPDKWTEGISDSQRYKCLGNAVTVNVIEYLIKSLGWDVD